MPKFPPVQPRHRRDWRVVTTAVAAVALVGGATAMTPHLTAHGTTERTRQAAATSYDGSVPGNGAGVTVYDYPGSGTLDTSLTTLGTLTEGTQASGACPDVDVVFARGTGEHQDDHQGLASVGQPFVDALTKQLPGKTVQAYGVQFQADYAQVSTIAGANDMENHVKTVAARCPHTKFVLGGYSQGASVVDLTLGLGPVLAPVYATAGLILSPVLGLAAGPIAGTLIATQPGLPQSLAGRIAAVVTWGNPIHWANQSITTASPVYGPRSGDFCTPRDPVCANGTDFTLTTHRAYATNGNAQQGAQFAAHQVNPVR
jgi:cutinase